MKKPLIATAVVVGLILAALVVMFAFPTPTEGTVKDKDYTAGQFDTDCKKVGKTRKCKTEWEEEVCQLYLVNGKHSGWREVPCAVYNNTPVGSYYRP